MLEAEAEALTVAELSWLDGVPSNGIQEMV